MEWVWRLAEAVKARRARSPGVGWCLALPSYESCLQDVLPREGGVAVDVGAYIGRHTLAYARAVGTQGRVIAVEPQADNFKLLQRNVAVNGLSQVQCVLVALGAENGETCLRFDRETSTASLVRDLPLRQRVPLMTMDALLAFVGVDKVDFIKIDAEGSELEILDGSEVTLSQSPGPRLLIEVHSRSRRLAATGCPVADWLTARGYSITELVDGKRRFHLACPGPHRTSSKTFGEQSATRGPTGSRLPGATFPPFFDASAGAESRHECRRNV